MMKNVGITMESQYSMKGEFRVTVFVECHISLINSWHRLFFVCIKRTDYSRGIISSNLLVLP